MEASRRQAWGASRGQTAKAGQRLHDVPHAQRDLPAVGLQVPERRFRPPRCEAECGRPPSVPVVCSCLHSPCATLPASRSLRSRVLYRPGTVPMTPSGTPVGSGASWHSLHRPHHQTAMDLIRGDGTNTVPRSDARMMSEAQLRDHGEDRNIICSNTASNATDHRGRYTAMGSHWRMLSKCPLVSH